MLLPLLPLRLLLHKLKLMLPLLKLLPMPLPLLKGKSHNQPLMVVL